MERDRSRSGASPSWCCRTWGWGRGALRTEFKRKPSALWRSWEDPMVGESMLCNCDLNRCLLSPVTSLGTFQGQPHLPYRLWLSALVWRREGVKQSQGGFWVSVLLLCVHPWQCAPCGYKGHLIVLYPDFCVFSSQNSQIIVWDISWKS